MSPRRGGEADKFGNRYEGAWTIRYLLHVLHGTVDSVTVEEIDGAVGQGAEFIVRRSDVTEAHQVKRQHGTANGWTVRALSQNGVLSSAREHVAAGRQFHFVSTIPARPIQELSEKARQAENAADFVHDWLTSKELKAAFDQLASNAGFASVEVAWRTLCGLYLKCVDESEMTDTNAMLAGLLLAGATGHLSALSLGDVAVNKLGVRLDAKAIESELAKPKYGLTLARLVGSSTIAGRVDAITANWTAGIAATLFQPAISRVETHNTLEALAGDSQLVLLLGAAGGGKSAVLHQVVTSLLEDSVPVLAFRLDRLGSFSSTTQLGTGLELDLSPAAALAAVAADHQRAVLVIDQLDAVSLMSGRMPNNFDAVAALIREAATFPNIRVLLACRKFDAENDHRIRGLVGGTRTSKIEVTLLPDDHVVTAVQAMGLDPGALTRQQRELLRSPLNLVLLQSVAGALPLSFQSAKGLFDLFWQHKSAECSYRRDGTVRFAEVLYRLAEEISKHQKLAVSDSIFDRGELAADANILISEHVLVRDGSQVAFFHESFFDYVFARSWLDRGQSVVDFLIENEQELFRRGQVRQILSHLRELGSDRFVTEVETLLLDERVRFHIKDVVLVMLRTLPDPTADEWEMLSRLLEAELAFEHRLWMCLMNEPWFARADHDGAVEEWLVGDDEKRRSYALESMARVLEYRPDRVAQIVKAQSGRAEYYDWLRSVTRFGHLHADRAPFDLVLEAVAKGAYDQLEQELWSANHDFGEHRPEWAVELVAAYLGRALAQGPNADGRISALLTTDQTAGELVLAASTGAPKVFADLLLPHMLQAMELTAYANQARPLMDRHFSYRHPDSEGHKLDDALLLGAATAVRILAEQDAEAADPILRMLAASPYDAAQWILYESVRVVPERHSEWIANTLLEGQHRFLCGYVENSVWTARQVLEVINPYLVDEAFREIELAILSFRLPTETRHPGWYSFQLLSALDKSRLSEVGRRRLGEYRRVFGQIEPVEPKEPMAGWIGPPISAEAAGKMKDDHWLKAITKYSDDQRDWGSFKGGAHELASLLQVQVADKPGRFARLAQRFGADLHPAYYDAVLRGFGDAKVLDDPSFVFEAIRHIAALKIPSTERWLGWSMRKYVKSDLPIDLILMVLDIALNSPDPAGGATMIRSSNRSAARDLHTDGINTARGHAAESLADILIHDADGSRTTLVLPSLPRLAGDPSLAVRACVVDVVLTCLRHGRPQAVEAYAVLIQADDLLLCTQGFERLSIYVGNGDPSIVLPVIERMLVSQVDEVREAGGKLAAFAALEWRAGGPLESVRKSSDLAAKKGAAAVCAARLAFTSDMPLAAEAIRQFAHDEDDEVRKAAARSAGALRDNRLRPFKKILGDLIASPAFPHMLPQLLITMERAPDRVDELTLQIARRFVDVSGATAGDIRYAAAGSSKRVGELLIRAYAQARTVAKRRPVLELVDELLLHGGYGVEQLVSQAER